MHKLFTLLLFLFGASVLLFTLWFSNVSKPINPQNSAKVEFIIEQGESLDKIGNRLQSAGLIRSLSAFKLMVWRLNLSQKIQAGYVYLSSSQSLENIIISLTKSTTKQVWVTIPEGLRRQEIAKILSSAFSKDNTQSKFDVQQFLSQTVNLEGKLFPDTYAFRPDSSTQEVINRLTARFDEIITKNNIPSQNLNQTVIIASLLEREAASDSEMPEIAGVIMNRLNGKWPLQIDATVQYAIGTASCRSLDCKWWPAPLSASDLKIKSAYNTYQNQGLPPAPICNPGAASLKAASNPVTTSNWFYLHGTDGQIHFAATSKEHSKNVCLYLKKDCQ